MKIHVWLIPIWPRKISTYLFGIRHMITLVIALVEVSLAGVGIKERSKRLVVV